jgi:predicted dinucleotide-binding enzyme
MGNPPFSVWRTQQPEVRVGLFSEAAAHGEMLINAANGNACQEVLTAAGEANLNGKTLVDIANPLDFSQGMPPSLFVSNTDSLAEQLQRAFPEVRIVKTLNTMNAHVMVDPGQLGGGDHTVFVSGDDPKAKVQVTDLLRSFGWQDIIDLGDLSTARGVEMILPIWLRLMGALQTPMINFKIVR